MTGAQSCRKQQVRTLTCNTQKTIQEEDSAVANNKHAATTVSGGGRDDEEHLIARTVRNFDQAYMHPLFGTDFNDLC